MYKRSLKWDRKGGRGDSGQLYQSRMRGEELGGGNDPVKVCQESREREREKREKAGTAQPAQIPHSKAFWAHSCASSTPYSQAKRVDVKTSHSIILHYFSQIKCVCMCMAWARETIPVCCLGIKLSLPQLLPRHFTAQSCGSAEDANSTI